MRDVLHREHWRTSREHIFNHACSIRQRASPKIEASPWHRLRKNAGMELAEAGAEVIGNHGRGGSQDAQNGKWNESEASLLEQ
ncbi:hypothetical protein JQ596_32070 [Bradyrhizobium manausense]|uniref:hypothetical protein n=1 Tax=Bradyrhizobium TaxID=374 RepID=UPI001BAB95A1|nr:MULTISPECIES: hypothetical protein [Bradyrhizobium]MBR0830176.1 hypothetical protein [Bradyrhizobium manausense]UVO30859.1 hypothetical protein KUF59_09525 [Bradyrhizobium arachidis]